MTDTAPLPPGPPEGAGTSPPEAGPSHVAAATTGSAPPAVNVTRLLAEAANKSDVAWLRLPDGATHPIWFVWHDDGNPRGAGPALYIVSGPGEQPLPWLPSEVEVIFRSKDTRGRLLTVTAAVREIPPESPQWSRAAEVLRPERLNTTGDVEVRWRESATIHVLAPHGRPSDEITRGAGRRLLEPAPSTTAVRRPWHWHGRPQHRRGTQV